MLTRGFKLYAGFGLAAGISALAYGVVSGDTSGPNYLQVVDRSSLKGVISLGWQGGVGEHLGYVLFFFVFLVSLFLALMMAAFSDSDPIALAEISDEGETPPAQASTAPSYWPIVLAFGLGLAVVGLATNPAIMVIGLVFAGIAGLEWAISAWSDRASSDPQVNKAVRNRLLWPVEVPVVGAAGVAVLVVGVWRVLIAVSEFSALWVATGITAFIFVVAVIIASAPKIGKSVVVAMVMVTALGVIAAGIVATAAGSRDFHDLSEEIGGGHEEAANVEGETAGAGVSETAGAGVSGAGVSDDGVPAAGGAE